jgi:hypothetical protein
VGGSHGGEWVGLMAAGRWILTVISWVGGPNKVAAWQMGGLASEQARKDIILNDFHCINIARL